MGSKNRKKENGGFEESDGNDRTRRYGPEHATLVERTRSDVKIAGLEGGLSEVSDEEFDELVGTLEEDDN